jgi:hypothetical protein
MVKHGEIPMKFDGTEVGWVKISGVPHGPPPFLAGRSPNFGRSESVKHGHQTWSNIKNSSKFGFLDFIKIWISRFHQNLMVKHHQKSLDFSVKSPKVR